MLRARDNDEELYGYPAYGYLGYAQPGYGYPGYSGYPAYSGPPGYGYPGYSGQPAYPSAGYGSPNNSGTPGLCAAKRLGTAPLPRWSGLWISEPAALLRFRLRKSHGWLSRSSALEDWSTGAEHVISLLAEFRA